MTSIVVVLVGGVVGPLILGVAAVLLPGAWAGVIRPLIRTSVLLALPLAISAALVNLFFFPGPGTLLFEVGPIRATVEGARFATEIVLRVLVIAGALTLFYLTTRTSDLVIDLERRGVSPRIAFIARSAVTTVPAMVDRASTITDAQRARGLDTEGSVVRRIRGSCPWSARPSWVPSTRSRSAPSRSRRGVSRVPVAGRSCGPRPTPGDSASPGGSWWGSSQLVLVLRAVGLDLP